MPAVDQRSVFRQAALIGKGGALSAGDFGQRKQRDEETSQAEEFGFHVIFGEREA
jgi:hypothetical protein